MKGYDADEEYDIETDCNFEFEMLNSADGKIITLVCTADKELTPDEYVTALRAFASRIETILTLGEETAGTLN